MSVLTQRLIDDMFDKANADREMDRDDECTDALFNQYLYKMRCEQVCKIPNEK